MRVFLFLFYFTLFLLCFQNVNARREIGPKRRAKCNKLKKSVITYKLKDAETEAHKKCEMRLQNKTMCMEIVEDYEPPSAYCPPYVDGFCGLIYNSSNFDTLNVDGQHASDKEYPHHAVLHIFDGNKNVRCGGSLISRSFVVTAAHCVFGYVEYVLVILGNYNEYEFVPGSVELYSKHILIHPKYDTDNPFFDIALIEIMDVEFSERISPICLPYNYTLERLIDRSVTVFGYAIVNENKQTTDTILQESQTNIIANNLCGPKWGSDGSFPNASVCVLSEEPITCYEDNGGSLLIEEEDVNGNMKLVLVGVTAISNGCDELPIVFTSVVYFIDWILNNTDLLHCRSTSKHPHHR